MTELLRHRNSRLGRGLLVPLKQFSRYQKMPTVAGAPPLEEASQLVWKQWPQVALPPRRRRSVAVALRMGRRVAPERNRPRVAAKRRNSYDIHC